jgi:GNAT superfamily N-acetyltransferase
MLPFTIRRATVTDAAVIADHRVRMFRDMGQVPTEALGAALLSESSAALAASLQDGSYVGWLAIHGREQVIAGAGAHVKVQLPRVSQDGARLVTAPVPLVVNVYTEPAWRGRGIARALMEALMAWATAEECDRVLLHASEAGRHLYQSLGFVATNEMRWSPARGTGSGPPGADCAATGRADPSELGE